MLEFWVTQPGQNKAVSAITRVEACSGICRLRKEGRLPPDQAAASLSALAAEILSVNEQSVNRLVLEAATTLVDRHNLKSLDAVQLGSAIVVREAAQSSEIRFISSDSELLRAAQAERFSVWNPQSASEPSTAQ